MALRALGLVLAGVATAVVLAAMVTWALPDENRVIPAPGVGRPAAPARLSAGSDPRTLELGRVYYAQICLSCHGVRGDGQGEWAYRVTPRPADLRSPRVQSRTDAQLFRIISDGLVGTPMIGWKSMLSPSQRRKLVAYLRTLATGVNDL